MNSRRKLILLILAVAAVPVACLDVEVDVRGTSVALAAACGDGTLDPGEQCDDGNLLDGDYCASDCLTGLDTTGANDSTDALTDLLSCANPAPTLFGRLVDLPQNAVLRISDHDSDGVAVRIDCRTRLRGNGTRLMIHPSDLTDAVEITAAAQSSSINELEIRYNLAPPNVPGATDHEHAGLRVLANGVVLRDIVVTGAGTGVELVPGSGGNTNLQRWENIAVFNCRRFGVRIEGLDASSGTFVGFSIQNTRDPREGYDAVGLLEASANGNVHIGHNLEVNDIALRVAPAGGLAPATFLGVYVEEGDPVEWVGNYSLNTTTVGGHLAALSAVKGDRFGTQNGRAMFRDETPNGRRLFFRVPDGDRRSAFSWGVYQGAPGTNVHSSWGLRDESQTASGSYFDIPVDTDVSRWSFVDFTGSRRPLTLETHNDTSATTYPNRTESDVDVNSGYLPQPYQSLCSYGANTCGF